MLIVMRRRERFTLHYSNVAFATIVFIYSTLIDAKNMSTTPVDHSTLTTELQVFTKMQTNSPKYEEIVTENEFNTTENSISFLSTINEYSTTSDKTSTKPIVTSTVGTSTTLTTSTTTKTIRQNNADQHTTYFNKFTTMRPLIIPTLPDYRRRISHKQFQSKHHHDHHWGPFFEEPLNTTGTLQVGFHFATEAILNCRVGMLKDKTVMWVRRTTDKVSLLTVGNVTYTGDPRIKVIFQYPNNWRLHINPINNDDAGLYMCQVSTHPPRVFATNLTVLAPAIRLVDELGHEVNDRYYKLGSSVDITCQVAISFLSTLPTSPPDANKFLTTTTTTTSTTTTTFPFIDTNLIKKSNEIFYNGNHKIKWKKDGKDIPKDIKVNLSSSKNWKNSRISILHAEKSHSGTYECSITNSTFATVNIQILMGETPAAVQHNHSTKNEIFNIKILIFNMGLLISSILHISCL